MSMLKSPPRLVDTFGEIAMIVLGLAGLYLMALTVWIIFGSPINLIVEVIGVILLAATVLSIREIISVIRGYLKHSAR